jgi:hypothetical protein
MRRFEARQAILEAAQSELSPQQMRRLRFAMMLRPFATQSAIDIATQNVQAAGMIDEDGEIQAAVDWSSIIALIIELLPLILKLFGL